MVTTTGVHQRAILFMLNVNILFFIHNILSFIVPYQNYFYPTKQLSATVVILSHDNINFINKWQTLLSHDKILSHKTKTVDVLRARITLTRQNHFPRQTFSEELGQCASQRAMRIMRAMAASNDCESCEPTGRAMRVNMLVTQLLKLTVLK